MIHVIAVGGAPATGKSTLFRAFLDSLPGPWAEAHEDALRWLESPKHRAVILGNYGEGPFQGTDRLSMAVQPVATKTLLAWASSTPLARPGWTIFFEGDRLFNLSFLRALRVPNIKLTPILLEADESLLELRHKEREDTQSETWLKGRLTKLARIRGSLPLTRWRHETPEDTKTCVLKLKELLDGR